MGVVWNRKLKKEKKTKKINDPVQMRKKCAECGNKKRAKRENMLG